MHHGLPEWVTAHSQTGVLRRRHQVECFGVGRAQTSAYHPLSSGAVQRLVHHEDNVCS